MPLSLTEVEHIAHLARLNITEEEKNRYRDQLSAILDHVTQLQKLDTSEVQPTSGVFRAENSLRADEARPGLTPQQLLSTAADHERNQYKIPPVFE